MIFTKILQDIAKEKRKGLEKSFVDIFSDIMAKFY
jgi:hypothetical protein